MKAKPHENQLLFDNNSGGNESEFRFQVHLYGKRWSHALGKLGRGRGPDIWKKKNRFLVHYGKDGGEFLVYENSTTFEDKDATKYMVELGYVNFRAAGSIDSADRIIRFEQPTAKHLCTDLLRRVTHDDSRLVEYYKGFEVFASNGASLGKVEAYWLPE